MWLSLHRPVREPRMRLHFLTAACLVLVVIPGVVRADGSPALDERTALAYDPVDEQKALAVVRKYKGEFERGNDLLGTPVVKVSLYSAEINDDEVLVLTQLPYLRSLRLHAVIASRRWACGRSRE